MMRARLRDTLRGQGDDDQLVGEADDDVLYGFI